MIKFLVFKGQQGGLVDRCLPNKSRYLIEPSSVHRNQHVPINIKMPKSSFFFFKLESLIKLIGPQARLVKRESTNS